MLSESAASLSSDMSATVRGSPSEGGWGLFLNHVLSLLNSESCLRMSDLYKREDTNRSRKMPCCAITKLPSVPERV